MTKEIDKFVHLHSHADFSVLDGASKVSSYAKAAAERGNPALAFTDHGTLRGYYQHHVETTKVGVKPIFGVEFYVCLDASRKGITPEEREDITKNVKGKAEKNLAVKAFEEKEGLRDRWHITVWAKNDEGLKNLYRLSSKSWIDGFYFKPRIDLGQLIAHKEGLMCATGCLSSPINDRVISGKRKAAIMDADRLREAFGDDMWIEVQPHNLPEQVAANKFALQLKQRYPGAQLLATQDAHYVNQEDAEHHEVLLCIGTGSNLSDPNRFKFDGDEFFMKNRKQMFSTFRKNHSYMETSQVREALNNTVDFAEMCTAKVEIDHLKALLPQAPVPDEYRGNDWGYIKALCVSGWRWREIPQRAALYAKLNEIPEEKAIEIYKKRLNRELKEIRDRKVVGYFLVVQDLYKWMRKSKVAVGPGRGSAAGSLVSFLLGITAVDPIEHGLMFERFLSPGRTDLPDIDMDIEDVRRGECIQYLKDTYGEDKVCQIATVSKLSGKEVVKSVCRVLEVPYAEANAITDSIMEKNSGDERAHNTVEDSFAEFKVLQDFNKKYPLVLHHAKQLEGLSKNLGVHAAGVVIAPQTLSEIMPLEARKSGDLGEANERVIVSAIDMLGVAAIGLLKLDLLGLRTLTILSDAVKEIERRRGEIIDLEKIPLDHENVLQVFTDHDYVGIFQYDSASAERLCQGIEFTHFEDIATMTALNRPGTGQSGLAAQFIERKKNPKLVEKSSFHPKISEITSDTLGVIVYQEHVIRILTDFAGFSAVDADGVRRKIGKRVGSEQLEKDREKFVTGAQETSGVTKELAGKLMDAIVHFGKYSFNKAHATSYAMLAYWGAYLKVNYAPEFYLGLLMNAPDGDKVMSYSKDAKKHGVSFLPPHVNTSGKKFKIDDSLEVPTIRGSLLDIKGVGEKAATSIIAGQPYKDMTDFLARIERRCVHRGAMVALAKAGALKGLVPNTKWFVENAEKYFSAHDKKKGGPQVAEAMLMESSSLPQYAPEEAQLISSKVNPLVFGEHPLEVYKDFIKKNVRVINEPMTGHDFFAKHDNKSVYIAGVILEVKFSAIGDYHDGPLPSEVERSRQFWGYQYANVTVEDSSGFCARVKVDIDIFEQSKHILELGSGTPVYVHASVNGKYENLKAHFVVDLETLRKKISFSYELDVYESLLIGKHPILDVLPEDKPDIREKVYRNLKYKRARIGEELFYGLVTNVRIRFDKNGHEMAFFGLIGGDNYFIDAVCFGSNWSDVKHLVKAGQTLKIELEKQQDRERGTISHIYNGGLIKRIKKEA